MIMHRGYYISLREIPTLGDEIGDIMSRVLCVLRTHHPGGDEIKNHALCVIFYLMSPVAGT